MNTKCANCGKPLAPRSVAEKSEETVYCRACAMKILEGHNTSRTETRVAIQSELQSESMSDMYGPGASSSATAMNGPKWVKLKNETGQNSRRHARVYSRGRKIAGAGIFIGTLLYGSTIVAVAYSRVSSSAHHKNIEPVLSEVIKKPPQQPEIIPPQATETETQATETPQQQKQVAKTPVTPEKKVYVPPAPVEPAPPKPSQTLTPAPRTETVTRITPPTPAVPSLRMATALLTMPDEVGGGDIRPSTSGGLIGNITPNAWAKWTNIDFGAKGSIASINVLMHATSSGHKIDVRLDDPENGPVIGTILTNETGTEFKPQSTDISDVEGKHTVYLVFGNFDSGEIKSLTFSKEPPVSTTARPVVLLATRMNGQSAPNIIKHVNGAITATKANAWARFDQVEFNSGSGYRSMLIGAKATAANQKITIKLDDAANGRTLASVNIPAGGAISTIAVNFNGKGITGTHKVFVIFNGTAAQLQTITIRP